MTPQELRTQLVLMGVNCRVRGDEVQVEVCRFCGNERWNLDLSAPLGVYRCWACRMSGRLDSLLTELTGSSFHIPVVIPEKGASALRPAVHQTTDFAHVPANEMESARWYLSRRGLGDEEIGRYGIVVCTEKGHRLEGRIVLPVRDFWSGAVIAHVGRQYIPRRKGTKYITTLDRQMITGYRTRDRTRPCVIVEGPFDGIAVHRAGFQAAILSGTGSEDITFFAARLPPETPLVIMLDGSAEEEARRLYNLIFPIRSARLVTLPRGLDPAEFSPIALEKWLRLQLAL